MKSYDKKFLIYTKCMIRSFGQAGTVRKNFSCLFFKLNETNFDMKMISNVSGLY